LFLVKLAHHDLLMRLKTILGIGPKTAIMLVVLTRGFDRFTSTGELHSYVGLTPVISQSGSSVKGRTRSSKIGNQKPTNPNRLASYFNSPSKCFSENLMHFYLFFTTVLFRL
jgi:transposase